MEYIFADGIRFLKPSPKAPDWVKGHIAIKVEEFTNFINANQHNGWVDIDLKESKNGKLYLELNTFKKDEPTTIRNNS